MVPYQQLFIALDQKGIRYIVAGGFAVNFHQVQRATIDLDLVLHLETDNVLAFVSLMRDLGYTPRLPVDAQKFADPAERERWINEKGMMVFSFLHSKNPYECIDVFVREPKPFAELYAKRLDVRAFDVNISVLGKDDLIEMKRLAGRDKDLFDIQQLEKKK